MRLLSRKLWVTVGFLAGCAAGLVAAVWEPFAFIRDHTPIIIGEMAAVVIAYIGIQGWVDNNGHK